MSMSDTGMSLDSFGEGLNSLADKWLQYQQISKTADVERMNSENNVLDRIDAKLKGSPATTPAAGISMKWVGIGLAAVVGLVIVFKLIK